MASVGVDEVQRSSTAAIVARLDCVAVMERRYQPLPASTIELLTALKPELDPAED